MISFDFLTNFHLQYSNGDCWVLARKLNEVHGLDIVVSPNIDEWVHAAVQTSGGLIVDIEGIYNLESFSDKWGFPIYWDSKKKLSSDMTFYGKAPHWDQAEMLAGMIVNRLNQIGVIL